jgi:hypothetical protein
LAVPTDALLSFWSVIEMVSSTPATNDRRMGQQPERGAVLVEFAIVSVILFTMLFGIIEFGSAFNDYQSLRQAVREGARSAVVGATSPGCTGTATAKAECAVRDGEPTIRVHFVYVDNAVSATDPTGFASDSVKVCATRLVAPITGFFPLLNNKPLRSEITMRAERDGLGLTTGSDVDPSGANWSWC